MIDPGQGGWHVSDARRRRQGRPREHIDRQTEGPGGGQFASGGRPTAVFGDHRVDPVFAHQAGLVFRREGTDRLDVADVRHRQGRHDRIDTAHQVTVLGKVDHWSHPGGPWPGTGALARARFGPKRRPSRPPRANGRRRLASTAGGAGPARGNRPRPPPRPRVPTFARRRDGWRRPTDRLCSAVKWAAKPVAPPKPPSRTGTGWATGAWVRPAKDMVTVRSPRAAKAPANWRASVVPPRIKR